ncbi:MAG TPA: SPASM domain-containing protein [Vicinamibacteria bacterium]
MSSENKTLHAGPPPLAPPVPAAEGNVDRTAGGTIAGWAWDPSRPDVPVEVEVRRGPEVLARVLAAIWRKDLQMAGKGGGAHGFVVDLASRLGPGSHAGVEVVVLGTDVHIATGLRLEVPSADGVERRRHTEGRFCSIPFEKFVIEADGNVYLCCPSYLPTVVGNAYRQTFREIWNSAAAQEVRASIVDGSYRHCLDCCPAIQAGELPPLADAARTRHAQAVASEDYELAYGPVHLALLQDRTCNISCPSCRDVLIYAGVEEQKRLRTLIDRVIEPMLAEVETLEVAGGEFLASRHLREVIARIDPEKHPHVRIAAFTNGTLFNERAWADLANVHGRFQLVYVSLDAARPATFEKLRRGGRWDVVRRNLDFIAELRRADAVGEFAINFVVQRDNYREMLEFIALGKQLGCDSVRFHELFDFGTYPPGEFQRLNVLDPEHPEHPELLDTLRDRAFDDPIVNLANLTATRRRALAAAPGAPAL